MERLSTFDAIRIVIDSHQNLILSGGISESSSAFRSLERTIRLLLLMFKLPATKENLLAAITYPLCQPNDSKLKNVFYSNSFTWFVRQKEPYYGFTWDKTIFIIDEENLINMQVKFVLKNLYRLVEQHKKK